MANQTDLWFGNNYGYSEDDWANPEYLFADDDSYATATYTGQISYVINFNFQIPYQAKITGVEVQVQWRINPQCTVSKPGNQTVLVTPDAWVTSGSKTQSLTTTTFTTYTYGGSGDLWGTALKWSPDSFNSNAFQVAIQASLAGTWSCNVGYTPAIHCDFVQARIHYQMPDSPHPFMQVRQGMLSPGNG
jgi:hypothetical protein